MRAAGHNGGMTPRSRWFLGGIGVGVGVIVIVTLLLSGFTESLPSMVGGAANARNIVVQQPTPAPYPGPRTNEGYDVSFPQCGQALPDTPGGFGIVGLTGGRPATDQECFGEQIWWAQQQNGYAVYVNTEYDGVTDPVAAGQAIADDAAGRLTSQYLPNKVPVWLDVETDNQWRGSRDQHRTVIEAAAARLAELGHPVGVYSAPRLWQEITGGIDPGMPVWLGIGENDRQSAEAACGRIAFGDRRPSMVQWIEQRPDGQVLDHDLICPGVDPAGLLLPVGFRN